MSASSCRRSRLARTLAIVGSTNLQERRVLLHAVDEDEAPRVLELALDGHQVELAPHLDALGSREAVGAGVVVEARLHEGAVEGLVAVVEQGDEIVDARAQERVLEVDPAEALVRANHQVARLVVAVHEAPGPRGDAVREAVGDRVEGRAVLGGQRDAARLEGPLAEVVDLPAQQLVVEGAGGHDAAGGQRGEGALRPRQVRDRADVQGLAPRRVGGEEGRERVVAQVFEQEPPAGRVLAEQRGDVDAARVQQVAHLEEGPPRGRLALGDLLGLGAVGDEHGDGLRHAAEQDAEVAARGGAPGHGVERRRPAAGKGARDERRRGSEVELVLDSTAGRVARTLAGFDGKSYHCHAMTANTGQPAALVALVDRVAAAFEAPVRRHLVTWLERLQEWNARIDLTAARSPEELVDLMLADAVELAPASPRARASSTWGPGPARPGWRSRSCDPTCA